MKKSRNYFVNKGFTLIELLIVIAIIGGIASIVLASLNSARNKSDRAVIASSMDTIRKQAEIYHASNGNYGATWSSSPFSIVSGLGSGVVSYYQGQNPKPFSPSFFSDVIVLKAMDQIFSRVTVPGPGGISSPTVFWALDPTGSKWAFAAVMLKVELLITVLIQVVKQNKVIVGILVLLVQQLLLVYSFYCMKYLKISLPIIFLLFGVCSASAATYYVDATGGSNTNNGTSTGTAWQTISKVNSTTLVAGDNVLFKKGETFTGQLSVNQSGTVGNLITYGAYGSGANPIFNAASSLNYPIYIDAKSYIKVENITVQNPTAASILLINNNSNIQIDSVAVSGGPIGIFLLSGTQSTISISNTTITSVTDTGVAISPTTATGITLSNVDATGGNKGIFIDGNTTGLTISNGSTFTGATTYGFDIDPARTLTTLVISDSHFDTNGTQGVLLRANVNGVTISNSSIDNNGGHGLYLNPATGKTIQNVTITDSTISGNDAGYGLIINGVGTGTVTGLTLDGVSFLSNAYMGISVTSAASTISITDSTFNDNRWGNINFDATSGIITGVTITNTTSLSSGANGFAFLGSSGGTATLTNVTASNNENDGINVKGSWDVDVVGCVANTNGDGDAGSGDGLSWHDSSTGSIKYCFVSNNLKSAIAHVGDSDVDMSYNVFRHDTNGTIALAYLEGTGTYTMYNNTIYSAAQTGTGVETSTPTGPTLTFKNNIIYGFNYGLKKTAGTITEDYNLIYNAATSNWSGLTQGTHSIAANPLFTNAGSNDFSLQSTSPAIDVGVTIDSTYDDALHPSTVFVSSMLTTDQDLRGAGWELGAYIYPVPQAPTIGATDVLTSASLRFNFTDNATDETGFKLYSNSNVLATTDATTNLTSINGTSLSSNTGYSGYYVKAYNSYGESVASGGNTIAYTLAATPTILTLSPSTDSVTVSGGALTNDTLGSSGYYFANSTNSTNSGWIQSNSWQDTGLTCATSYSYSVKYRNFNGVETSPFALSQATNGCGGVPIWILQAMSDSLRQGQSSINSPVTNSSSKFTFNKNLQYKNRNEEIKKLQEFLNRNGFPVALNGVGSKGFETTYFGLATKNALIKYQKANNIKPAIGYFGPLTRSVVNLK